MPNSSSLHRDAIAKVDLWDLVEQFGTPTYVYDAAMIRRRIAELKAFDVIRFAQKANSNLSILRLMREQGVVVDAVSAGEIHRALVAGFPPNGTPPPIVYTADIFDRPSLELVVEKGIHVNCGSPDMLEQLGARLPGAAVTLRVNPGFGHGHSQKTNTGGPHSKHGIWHTELSDCLLSVDRLGLAVTGLHMHIGSGTDLEHLSKVCHSLEETARLIGRSIMSISAGGGLPTVYQSTDVAIDLKQHYELWNATRQRLQDDFGHPVSLEVEPGRYLTADSGFLICEIRAIKRMGDNWFYLVDAGFNNLARPVMYGSYHPISICSRRPSQSLRDVVVGGPLCESGDIFTQHAGGYVDTRRLPHAQVGDLLIIECAGAYGFVMSSNYNSKPLAAEVLIEDATPRLIRRQQPIEELWALE